MAKLIGTFRGHPKVETAFYPGTREGSAGVTHIRGVYVRRAFGDTRKDDPKSKGDFFTLKVFGALNETLEKSLTNPDAVFEFCGNFSHDTYNDRQYLTLSLPISDIRVASFGASATHEESVAPPVDDGDPF